MLPNENEAKKTIHVLTSLVYIFSLFFLCRIETMFNYDVLIECQVSFNECNLIKYTTSKK